MKLWKKAKEGLKEIERKARPGLKKADEGLKKLERKARPGLKKADEELKKLERKARPTLKKIDETAKDADFFVRNNGGWKKSPEILTKFLETRTYNSKKIAEVIPNFLYISSKSGRDNHFKNHPNDIQNNLSVLASDAYNPLLTNTNLLVLPTDDHKDYPIFQYFEQATQFIAAAKSRNEKVIVNCRLGINRSTTIVIAYLMLHEKNLLAGKQTYDAAAKYLIEKKGLIGCNRGFTAQLKDWERKITNEHEHQHEHQHEHNHDQNNNSSEAAAPAPTIAAALSVN